MIIITEDKLKELVTPESVKSNTSFESINNMSDELIKRTIRKAIRLIESKRYINRRLLGLAVSEGQFEDLGIAIEELTISMLLASSDENIVKGYKSEKLSDYSYTIGEHAGQHNVDIDYLIEGLKDLNLSDRKNRISII